MKSAKSEKSFLGMLTLALTLFLGVSAVVFQTNICDGIFSKRGMIVFLTVSFVFSCVIVSTNLNKTFKIIWHSVSLVLCLIVGYNVFIKDCSQLKPATAKFASPTYNGPNNSNTHNKSYTNKTYIYTSKPQRVINSDDISKLKSNLLEKDDKIIVQYLKSNDVDTLLWGQVFNELLSLGFKKVYKSTATTLPDYLQKGRITIRKETVDDNTQYSVIINPQN